MSIRLNRNVPEFLKNNPGLKFTARDIAEWIFKSFPKECAQKKEQSKYIKSDDELVQQIVAEIGANRPAIQSKFPQVKTTEERPRKYFWSETPDNAIDLAPSGTSADQGSIKPILMEHDLYPLLCAYLWSELGLYPRRIDEKKSSNKQGPNGNKWLYPDLVAMENLSSDWHESVKSIVNEMSEQRVRFWSFEVKRVLNQSNARECYFQAVSNSSWSNRGYLVAADIVGSQTLTELRMLYGLHGIGLIQLNTENPAESQILIPARERNEVDWSNCNRLAIENKDFKDFIVLVRQFHQTGDLKDGDWDLPTSTDD
jgi:hypothetical protein